MLCRRQLTPSAAHGIGGAPNSLIDPLQSHWQDNLYPLIQITALCLHFSKLLFAQRNTPLTLEAVQQTERASAAVCTHPKPVTHARVRICKGVVCWGFENHVCNFAFFPQSFHVSFFVGAFYLCMYIVVLLLTSFKHLHVFLHLFFP